MVGRTASVISPFYFMLLGLCTVYYLALELLSFILRSKFLLKPCHPTLLAVKSKQKSSWTSRG